MRRLPRAQEILGDLEEDEEVFLIRVFGMELLGSVPDEVADDYGISVRSEYVPLQPKVFCSYVPPFR